MRNNYNGPTPSTSISWAAPGDDPSLSAWIEYSQEVRGATNYVYIDGIYKIDPGISSALPDVWDLTLGGGSTTPVALRSFPGYVRNLKIAQL